MGEETNTESTNAHNEIGKENTSSSYSNSNMPRTEEQELQYKIQRCQLELYKQNSIVSTKNVKKNDFYQKINRLYSKLLVNYHWVFLIVGVIISCLFSGLGFIKQPLPNILDPKRGFGARGEGTLTSQLIVLKNINTELTKYHKYILDVYERIKKENRTFILEDSDYHRNFDFSNETYQDANQSDDLPSYDDNNDSESLDDKSEPVSKEPPKSSDDIDILFADDSINYNQEQTKRIKRDLSYDDLMGTKIYKKYTGHDIIKMLNPNLSIKLFEQMSLLDNCNFSLSLDENLEYYFTPTGPSDPEQKILDREFLNEIEKNSTLNLDSKIIGGDQYDSDSLLNMDKLRSLCKWDETMLNMLKSTNKPVCHLSLPRMIALLNNKTSCFDINEQDVKNFIKITLMCYPLHKSGVLYAFSEEYKQKPEIINLLNKNNPINEFIHLPQVKDNLCVHKNVFYMLYEHLLDKNYLTNTKGYLSVKYSSLVISNYMKQFNENFLFNFYMKQFHSVKFEDGKTHLIGLNLAGIRQEAAMRIISSEMSLVALAITLIVIVTLLYLRSIFISMIVNLGVAMSVGVAFFAYRIVFDIELFPFLNMMAAFLLIGIACDNVYVLFDAWYHEKARIIMEDLPELIEKKYTQIDAESSQDSNEHVESQLLPPIFIKNKFMTDDERAETQAFIDSSTNPLRHSKIYNELCEKGININEYTLNPMYVRVAPLTDEQMVRIMSGTLHHAASSIFVTSFTTAAAFLTNLITKLPVVQLFGFFTGTCILVYFLMVITMVAAFVITYEKYIQPYRCKVTTNLTRNLEKWFESIMESVALLNHRIIAEKLPKLLIKFRVLWFLIFLVLGVCGMMIVFYKPKLRPPSSWRYQFFKTGNQFENFEFSVKDEFWSYVNEEKRNLTNPEIFIVFGIKDKDTGRVFNPDDDGHLVYDQNFDFLEKTSQIWLNKFINVSLAKRRDLFLVDEIVHEWNRYLIQMQQFCYETMNIPEMDIYSKIHLPYERESLAKCQEEIKSFLVDSTVDNFEMLMASFPRRIIFISNGSDLNAIMLRLNANRTFLDYDTVRDYYLEIKKFHEEEFSQAPDGFNTGWFISVAFALYDLQYQLITGTYSSLVTSMVIALVILLFTSGNILISIYAIITISFSIAITIAIFVLMGWDLSILESVVIIMSVGLSVDFSCHYGVAYINSDRVFDYDNSLCCNTSESQTEQTESKPGAAKKKCKFLRNILRNYRRNNKERFIRINDIFKRVGSAVLMAAFTTFLAGSSMYPSGLTSFGKMGQFLMLVMFTSYLYATFFFVPMCALFGPTKNFGNLRFKEIGLFFAACCCRSKKTKNLNVKLSEDNEDSVRLNKLHENGSAAASSPHDTSNL